MADLAFTPLSSEICEATGTMAWQARRGAFIYTIVESPIEPGGYGISVAYSPDHFPTGPFDTLEAAASACNRAANIMGS